MVPPVCCGLVALEVGALALGRGLHAGLAVVREERAYRLIRLPVEPPWELVPVGAVNGSLGRLDRQWSVRGDLRSQFGRPRSELARGIDVIDEADAERLRGVEAAGRVDQLLGHADADGARQTLGAAHVGDDAELDLRDGEDRALGGEADVAAECQLHARPDAPAPNGRDHRHADPLEAREAFLEVREVLADPQHGRGRRALVETPQRGARLDVEAGAEGAARAFENYRAHAGRRVHRDGGLADAFPHLDVHGVEPLGLLSVIVATGALISTSTLLVMSRLLGIAAPASFQPARTAALSPSLGQGFPQSLSPVGKGQGERRM